MNPLACIAPLLLALPASESSPTYRFSIHDLGPISYGGGSTLALDESATVTGTSDDGEAFVWSQGAFQLLPDLEPSGASTGTDVNNRGVVVGGSRVGVQWHAATWINGAVTDLGTFGGLSSMALAVNDHQQIVGFYRLGGGGTTDHAFLIDSSGFSDLGTLGGTDSLASGVNAHGVVCGHADDPNERMHAVVWESGVIRDLGTLSGASYDSFAHGINDWGEVVGKSGLFGTNDIRATVWHRGEIRELPNPVGSTHTIAYEINNRHEIVGTGDDRALLWTDGTVIDLNDCIPAAAGWVLEGAVDIDDAGRIVGFGWLNGSFNGFLLHPTPSLAPASQE